MSKYSNISNEHLLLIAHTFYAVGHVFKSTISSDNDLVRPIRPYHENKTGMEYSITTRHYSKGHVVKERIVRCTGGMNKFTPSGTGCSNPVIYSDSKGFCPVYVEGHGWIYDIIKFANDYGAINTRPKSKFGLKIP